MAVRHSILTPPPPPLPSLAFSYNASSECAVGESAIARKSYIGRSNKQKGQNAESNTWGHGPKMVTVNYRGMGNLPHSPIKASSASTSPPSWYILTLPRETQYGLICTFFSQGGIGVVSIRKWCACEKGGNAKGRSVLCRRLRR